MNKRDKKNNIIFLSLLTFIILYLNIITTYFKEQSITILSSFLILISFVIYRFLGYKKDKTNILKKSIYKTIIIELILYFILIYTIGIFNQFNINKYLYDPINIINNILLPTIIIIFSELLRYIIVNANKDKKIVIILITIILSILEITYNTHLSILSIITKNILMTYITYNVGYKINIIYRILTELYMFIIPIIPNINSLLNTILYMSLYLITYIYTNRQLTYYNDRNELILSKQLHKKIDTIIYGIIIILLSLVSGIFPIFMMGVGSGSMEPKLSTGDAIILTKIKSIDELEIGDIIAYKNEDNITIVHRITKKEDDYFITKGDNNKVEDRMQIKIEDIEGKVLISIPYIAYPSILINNIIKGE